MEESINENGLPLVKEGFEAVVIKASDGWVDEVMGSVVWRRCGLVERAETHWKREKDVEGPAEKKQLWMDGDERAKEGIRMHADIKSDWIS